MVKGAPCSGRSSRGNGISPRHYIECHHASTFGQRVVLIKAVHSWHWWVACLGIERAARHPICYGSLPRGQPQIGQDLSWFWNSGKEKSALDNLFESTGGEGLVTQGWPGASAGLGNRFGVTTDGGHVTKIILAANNQQGKMLATF